jgi:2-polyprenyl-3-methyl-5-hydroxy-6-metoxy-1,4-benzoquinol methylase
MQKGHLSKQNSVCCAYDSWAIKQLQNNYDQRQSLLEWKAGRLADLVPDHIHFTNALEIGIGEGIVLNKLGELLQIDKCLGVDISQVFLSFGKMRYADITFIRNNGLNLPFSDRSIDLIILSDIIEHIRDLDSFFKEVQRVGKYVLLKTPLERYLWRKMVSAPLGRSFQVGSRHPDGHLHEFSKSSLERMLEKFGFKILNYEVVYRPISVSEDYRTKKGLLRIRWYLDYKLEKLFPEFAYKIFGGDCIAFLSL